MTLNIGCHLSVSKGFLNMAQETLLIDGNAFQFFSRNPRGGGMKKPDVDDIQAMIEFGKEHHFAPILAHAPYTLNPASADEKIRDFARMVFVGDLDLMERMPGNLYNFHPGSHVGQGEEEGIRKIVQILNETLREDQRTTVLLETMSGKGSEIGRNFSEIQAIIAQVENERHLGVCLDTCHVFAAGYDIVNQLDEVIDEFDRVIGLKRLKAIHLNDSMMPFGSNKDRHAKIGEGLIGFEALRRVICHPALRNLPFYLETPNDELTGYAEEIKMLKSAYSQCIETAATPNERDEPTFAE